MSSLTANLMESPLAVAQPNLASIATVQEQPMQTMQPQGEELYNDH